MEGENNERFFNFPVKMMQGVLLGKTDKNTFLKDVIVYASYWKFLELGKEDVQDKLEYKETEKQRMLRVSRFYKFSTPDAEKLIKRGEEIHLMYMNEKIYTGINTKIYWDFREDTEKIYPEKSDFEWRCLFAILALKSIIGRKDFVKTNNHLLYARMVGKASTKDQKNPNPLFLKRYQREKMINALRDDWGLKYYSLKMYGFYVSFEVELNELVFEAEKIRKSVKEKIRKKETENAVNQALKRLGIERAT